MVYRGEQKDRSWTGPEKRPRPDRSIMRPDRRKPVPKKTGPEKDRQRPIETGLKKDRAMPRMVQKRPDRSETGSKQCYY